MIRLEFSKLELNSGGVNKDFVDGYCKGALGVAAGGAAAGIVFTGWGAAALGLSLFGCALGGYY